MNSFVNALRDTADRTTTENGAVTYSTSMDPIVDMFFHLPAKRGAGYNDVAKYAQPAFEADAELALRVALWLRDAREGAGERQTFKHVVRYLVSIQRNDLIERIVYASAELGRFDDLFFLFGTSEYYDTVVSSMIVNHLKEGNQLAAKWMPRKGPAFGIVRKAMGMTAKQFRKFLVELTNVVETQMCAKNWGEIQYSHVPSVAMTRYTKAFTRNDGERFNQFINRVRTGDVNPETGKVEKINTGAIYPYDVFRIPDIIQQDTVWNQLPDHVPEGISFLPIIDTSGSMLSPAGTSGFTCMQIATSLGIYLAERNKSVFKDLWINFHTNPSLKRVHGGTLHDKLTNLDYHNWGGSTNLEAAMNLIVKHAVDNRVPHHDMPDYLLVLSDMEFNHWGGEPAGRMTRKLFEEHGYKMPNIVWWNIQSRNGTTPVRAHEDGMALVSGFSPTIVKNLLAGEITPWKIMMSTIMKERYAW